MYSAVILVDDPAPPTVEPLTGALLTPGWHSENGSLSVGASDASGVKRLSLFAGSTTLYDQAQSCDYARMQPCPASKREAVAIDTSKLPDGTHQLSAVATDAAEQAGTATAVLRIDRHAPATPIALAVERNPDGTLALVWTNPDQGTAAPIVGARYDVCDAAGQNCVAAALVRRSGHRARSLRGDRPRESIVVRLWLQDEAGNVDPATAATLAVDPSTVSARRAVDTNPPVLLPDGPAPSAKLRITKARRTGSTLTLSGTIARGATATIRADVARTKTGKTVATAKTKPKKGKWSLRVKLTPALRKAGAMYLSVNYAGQKAFRKTTLHRRLAKKPPTQREHRDGVQRGAALSATPLSSSAGTGRPKRKPWPRRQPSARSASACSGSSMPSGISTSPSDSPMATIAFSRALSSQASRVKERSIFRTSIGKRRR